VDINKRHPQAQHEIRRTSREDDPTGLAQKKVRGLKEMRTARLQAMEETGAALQADARKLPSGPNRDELLQDIGNFRAQVAALQGAVQCYGRQWCESYWSPEQTAGWPNRAHPEEYPPIAVVDLWR
jgi:hypothetical protein